MKPSWRETAGTSADTFLVSTRAEGEVSLEAGSASRVVGSTHWELAAVCLASWRSDAKEVAAVKDLLTRVAARVCEAWVGRMKEGVCLGAG